MNEKLPAQDVLPFPPTPSGSIAGRTMQESVYQPRVQPRRLPDDAPNILIVLIDDAGPGLPTTFGGEVATPTLDRLMERGHRVQPVPHDGDVLADAGVAADRPQPPPRRQRPDRGAGERLGRLLGPDPQEQRARGRGAEGLRLLPPARGASGTTRPPRRRPRPARSTTGRPGSASSTSTASWPVRRRSTSRTWCATRRSSCRRRRPRRAITSARTSPTTPSAGCSNHQAFQPDKPFFMYWASGCLHGPHHVMKEWADKYAGKFDDGWDAYRERVSRAGQGEGLDSRRTRELTPRAPGRCRRGTSIPEDEKPFQRRLMEVAAGFAEHVDVQVGRLVDELDAARLRRQHADLLHLGRQRLLGRGPERHDQRAAGAERHPDHGRHAHRGARRARRPRRARLAEDRQPVPRRLGVGRQHAVPGHEAAGLAPRRHAQPDGRPLAGEDQARRDTARAVPPLQRHRADDLRDRRHHPAARRQRRPAGPDRRRELRLHASTTRRAEGRLLTQYFEVMGSRSIYHDGWMASAFGPRLPWVPGCPRAFEDWTPDDDTWELYNLDEDWSPGQRPRRADARQARADEGALRDRGGEEQGAPDRRRPLDPVLHPELRIAPPYTRMELHRRHRPHARVLRTGAGQRANLVTIDADIPDRRQRRALHARRATAAASPASSTTASSATSTTSSSSSAPRSARARSCRPARRRSRSRPTYAEPKPGGPLNITLTRQRRRSSPRASCRSARRCCSPPTCVVGALDRRSPGRRTLRSSTSSMTSSTSRRGSRPSAARSPCWRVPA